MTYDLARQAADAILMTNLADQTQDRCDAIASIVADALKRNTAAVIEACATVAENADLDMPSGSSAARYIARLIRSTLSPRDGEK